MNLRSACEENALKVVASPLNQHLEADEQIVFETQAGECNFGDFAQAWLYMWV